jgi:hypothetical protein
VIAGPGDEKAAAVPGRSDPRASRADRRQAADVLRAAFAYGWLTRDEFDARICWARASRTCTELAAVTADVPAGLDEGPLPRRPPRAKNPVKWGHRGWLRQPFSPPPLRSLRCAAMAAMRLWPS